MPGLLLQRWHLVGLQPMHDAMIRRLAIQECGVANKELNAEISIAWSTSDEMTSWSSWKIAEEIDVLIVAADLLIKMLTSSSASLSSHPLGTESRSCLRLVWSCLDSSQNDFGWATEYFANGVIVDPVSLQSWIRIAIRKARTLSKPPHPFLSDLKLPSA